MTDDNQAEPDWGLAAVLETLERTAGSDGQASAVVFLQNDVDRKTLDDTVADIVDEAILESGRTCEQPAIGKISRLAKSFSLTASPAIFSAIAERSEVKSILPSEIDDIYPKPSDPD